MAITTPVDDLRTLYGPAPDRSLEQRLAALARANDVRVRRAELKRDLKAGRRTASAVLADPPEWAEAMKVVDVLLALPRWGVVAVRRVCRFVEMSPAKTVGGLSPRQRTELLRWLHGR